MGERACVCEHESICMCLCVCMYVLVLRACAGASGRGRDARDHPQAERSNLPGVEARMADDARILGEL
eukprot:793961-Pleurochrysis_carterae.AAC.1